MGKNGILGKSRQNCQIFKKHIKKRGQICFRMFIGKKNVKKIFVMTPLGVDFDHLSVSYILRFRVFFQSKSPQAREVTQFQKLLKFLKSMNTDLSPNM